VKAGDRVVVDFTNTADGYCPCHCGRSGRYEGTVLPTKTTSRLIVVKGDDGKTFHELRSCVTPIPTKDA
jgi:hypothetical protein